MKDFLGRLNLALIFSCALWVLGTTAAQEQKSDEDPTPISLEDNPYGTDQLEEAIEESIEDNSPDDPKPNEEKEGGLVDSDGDFIPTEDISEDQPVPFPVDI